MKFRSKYISPIDARQTIIFHVLIKNGHLSYRQNNQSSRNSVATSVQPTKPTLETKQHVNNANKPGQRGIV